VQATRGAPYSEGTRQPKTHIKSEPLERRGEATGIEQQRLTKLVAAGYDQIADSYLQQFGQSAVRPRKLNKLADLLSSRAHVLDLGCGAGVPVARDLVCTRVVVTGVDASARQIERAVQRAPSSIHPSLHDNHRVPSLRFRCSGRILFINPYSA
jgi:2-polyprenyl-3-methyl-5-hydroxy-6-metoxy-1,4-benzoquinol methylase